MTRGGVVLKLDELDELNSKINFVNGVLEFLTVLSFNDLLERVEEKAVYRLTGEAQEKLEKVYELLNSKERREQDSRD